MKKVLFILLFLATSISYSQSLNNYKYAIVSSKFDFLKEKDQYRLNTLTKLLMEKYGFIAYFDNDILPSEVAESDCKKVFVEVKSNGNLFVTKLTVVLKDCKNAEVFTSVEGKSREKEYKVAYNQSLREAFNSFDALNHQFQEGKDIVKPDPIALQKADTAFGNVITASPTTQDAYIFRARTNRLLENDEMMATYYQQYLDVVTAKGEEEVTKNKAKFIESYNNIASTFANTDKAKAKELLNKTLALDPANAYALEAMKLLK